MAFEDTSKRMIEAMEQRRKTPVRRSPSTDSKTAQSNQEIAPAHERFPGSILNANGPDKNGRYSISMNGCKDSKLNGPVHDIDFDVEDLYKVARAFKIQTINVVPLEGKQPNSKLF